MYRNPKVGFLGLASIGVIYTLLVLYCYLFTSYGVTLLLELGFILVLPVLTIGAAIVYIRQSKVRRFAFKVVPKLLVAIFATLAFGLGVWFIVFGYNNSVFKLSISGVFVYFLICTVCLSYSLILIKRSFLQPYIAKFDRKLIFLSFR
jgi:hypothetical protein